MDTKRQRTKKVMGKSAYMAGMFLVTAVALSGCKTEEASKNQEYTVITTLGSHENVTENNKSDAANQVIDALQTSVYNVTPKTEPVLDKDYAQGVVTDENSFSVWNLTPGKLDSIKGKYGEGGWLSDHQFVPVEVTDGVAKECALRDEDGLYIISSGNGFIVWKDGKGIKLESKKLGSHIVELNLYFADIVGNGAKQLVVEDNQPYETGTGIGYLSYIWVIDLENMQSIEMETDDEYFLAELKNQAQADLDNNDYVEGYGYYLSDNFSNQYKFIESSDETSDKGYIFYHEIYVLGTKGARPQYFDAVDRKAVVRIYYRYDKDKNQLVVGDVSIE